jgi:transglutaminase-like putative cysteine protease
MLSFGLRPLQLRMEKQTLALLDSALDAVRRDLSPRVRELAEKSTAGTLTPEEQAEYADIVRLNDTLSLLKLQAEDLSTVRAAS